MTELQPQQTGQQPFERFRRHAIEMDRINLMFIFIIRRTQIRRFCLFGLFYTVKCFACPEQSSSGRVRIQTKSKGKTPLLTNNSYEAVTK